MCLAKLAEKTAKKMKWYDFSFLKMSVLFSTLFLVTVWEGFRNFVLGFEWYWYLALALISAAPLLKKMFWDK